MSRDRYKTFQSLLSVTRVFLQYLCTNILGYKIKRWMYIFTTFIVVQWTFSLLDLTLKFFTLTGIFLVETCNVESKFESFAARILQAAPRRLEGCMRPAGCRPMLWRNWRWKAVHICHFRWFIQDEPPKWLVWNGPKFCVRAPHFRVSEDGSRFPSAETY